MIRDITIGQYYPSESCVHKLDARLKIVACLLYIVLLFFVNHLATYIVVVSFLFILIKTSKVPVLFVLRGLKSIIIIIIFTVVVNILVTPGNTVLFQIYSVRVTLEGVVIAAVMGLRLVFLIIGSSLLTLTTSPIQLTDGLEYLMNPLKKIGVPSQEIAMMMSIALRFIPTLLEETDKIMKAQMARGADFDTGGIIKKAKSMVPLLVPLFVSAFRRAEELAMAMEARCYGGSTERTKLKELKMGKKDVNAIIIIALYTIVILSSWYIVNSII